MSFKSLLPAIIFLLPRLLSAQEPSQLEIVNEGFYPGIQWWSDHQPVDFINKDTGWVAGEIGLFKTTDGAENWELVYDDTILQRIDFCNDTIGWAYVESDESPDSDACIVKTLDGGRTWYKQRTVPELSGLYALSDSVVYSVESRPLNDKICKSVDGGMSWEDLPHSWNSIQTTCFYNPDTFIVIVNSGENGDSTTMFRTFDGGQTWDSIKTFFTGITNIRLVDGSAGYLTARYWSSVYHFKTDDTFSTWSRIAGEFAGSGDFHLFNPDTLIAIWSDDNCHIMKSTDGGSSWEQTDHMQLSTNGITMGGGYIIKLYVVDNVAYLFAWNYNMNFILKSTDQGSHWQCLNLTFPMQAVHFINHQQGFIGGSHYGFHYRGGFLMGTQDGGRTWDPVYDPGFTPARIYFLNDSIGFNCDGGGDNVFTTSDGGEHWRTVEEMRILGLHALNDSVSWLMDRNYQSTYNIKRTLDGGHTWETILKIGEFDPWNVSLCSIDENTGCAVGESGGIFIFSANGEWEKIESGTSLPLNKVVFVDQKYGLITGGYSNGEDSRSILLLTEDGGDHWTEGPEIPYLIHDLQLTDSLNGFAVGEDEMGHGVLLKIYDRGLSWGVVISGDDSLSVLRALYITDSTGWAVGDNSLMVKFDTTCLPDTIMAIDDSRISETVMNTQLKNHPNPFHLRTTVDYWLPASMEVELIIFDLSGRRIKTLVHEIRVAGKHEIEWNAEGMNPGIYLCELRTGYGRQVLKMILIQ